MSAQAARHASGTDRTYDCPACGSKLIYLDDHTNCDEVVCRDLFGCTDCGIPIALPARMAS